MTDKHTLGQGLKNGTKQFLATLKWSTILADFSLVDIHLHSGLINAMFSPYEPLRPRSNSTFIP